MLIAAALATGAVGAAAAADTATVGAVTGARAVARATATIRHPVTLQRDRVAAPGTDAVPQRQPARPCNATEDSLPGCRLVVYDLP